MVFVDKLVSRMSAEATEEVHNDLDPIESVLWKLQQRKSSALMPDIDQPSDSRQSAAGY